MYFLKILLISLLQFVLLKLHGKVDNISSKCLATNTIGGGGHVWSLFQVGILESCGQQ